MYKLSETSLCLEASVTSAGFATSDFGLAGDAIGIGDVADSNTKKYDLSIVGDVNTAYL